MTFSKTYSMTIDGAAWTAPATLPVIDPATGEAFAQAPDAGAAELDDAVAAARRAFPGWRATPLADRRRLLGRIAEAIEAQADDFAALFTREQGRPLARAKDEVLAGAAWLRGTMLLDLPVEVTEETARLRAEVHHEPLGVVGALVPWNFPFLLAIWKLAPALLAGNTLVLKPSPYTPLCALKLGEMLRPVLPPGVLNVISGGDALGPLMTAHPGFAKISFTGSTATGKRVMESVARHLGRLTLELGGNDAAIVLPDVDPAKTAHKIFAGCFFNTAQVCIATKRLYIHADIYEDLRDRLHALARAVRVGAGSEEGVEFGPVQNLRQYNRVKALIAQAREAGLDVLEGGDVPNRGYFIAPTLVDNPPDDAQVVTEEAFGPVVPLLKFDDLDAAIARANDSCYGLAGSVWSADVDKAVAVARQLDTGTVWINANLQPSPLTPFAGRKQSGLGIENGVAGLLEFTQPKAIFIPKGRSGA